MGLVHLVVVLHILRLHVATNTIMDQPQVADVLHILQHHAVVNMGLVLYAPPMEHKHAVLLTLLMNAVYKMFHFITHAVLHIAQAVAVHRIIHIMVGFAVPHMFIIHTKVELSVDNSIIVQ